MHKKTVSKLIYILDNIEIEDYQETYNGSRASNNLINTDLISLKPEIMIEREVLNISKF